MIFKMICATGWKHLYVLSWWVEGIYRDYPRWQSYHSQCRWHVIFHWKQIKRHHIKWSLHCVKIMANARVIFERTGRLSAQINSDILFFINLHFVQPCKYSSLAGQQKVNKLCSPAEWDSPPPRSIWLDNPLCILNVFLSSGSQYHNWFILNRR